MALWPHLMRRAVAWERGDSEVILKARQVGISWLLAAYALWRAAYQPGSVILEISSGQAEAYELLGKSRAILDNSPLGLRVRVDTDAAGELAFVGGGRILALPATQRAGRSYTASLIIVDEAAYHPWAEANYVAYKPALDGGGQLLMVSTANGNSGFFHKTYWDAVKKVNPYADVFIPWNARPHRDAEWLARERSAYPGLPAQFDQEYPDTPAAAFVGLTGLVYPQFSTERHVREADPVPWEECERRYFASDYGGGDPTALVVGGVYRGANGVRRAHIYDIFYRKSGAPTVEELYAFLAPYHERAPFTSGEGDPAPGGEVINESLRSMGLPCRRGNAARGEGLGLVAQYLESDWLTFNADKCGDIIHEFAGYRWLTRVDPNSKDRYATGTPHDHHGDALDALRLLVMGAYFDEMARRPKGGFRKAYAGVTW